MKKEYYVYCYYDKNRIPLYVGIGKNRRAESHLDIGGIEKETSLFHSKLKEVFYNGEKVFLDIIKDGLTKNEASIAEEVAVSILGRKNNSTGVLYNAMDGGIYAANESQQQKVSVYMYDNCLYVNSFKSIAECCRFFSTNEGTTRDALRGKYPTGTKFGKILLINGERNDSAILELKSDLLRRISSRQKNIKKVRSDKVKFKNLNTGDILEYDSVRDAEKDLKCCRKTLKNLSLSKKAFRKEWRVIYD